MSSSCMGKELPKEKKWGIKNCRERKCPELRKNENETYPEDSQERCQVFNTMPGTLPCCIQDMDHLPPEEFLRHCTWQMHEPWEKKIPNRKTPGPKNCPASCPYKISEQGEVFGKTGEAQWKKKPGTIWRCAFTGGVLGQGLGGSCPCHVLDNPDQEDQIKVLRQIIEDSRKPAAQALKCSNEFCPDGALRCAVGETTCPVIKLPLAEMKMCPLWRIPAKLLPAPAIEAAPKPTPEPEQNSEKTPAPESPDERLARGKAIREEVLENRETMKRMSTGRSAQKERKSPRALTQKEKPAEPEKAPAPEKKRKKPAADVPALNVLYLEDCESLTKRMEPESIDLIFTDPPYVTEPIDDDGVTQWERAYVALHLIASKVLKPSGFLITYAPQAHLHDIMEILAYGSSRKIMVNESGGQLDYFWIIPSLNGGATCKAHKWNALCLHKPILVYQKAPFKSPSKCFADVVRGKKQKSYHAWQQSVHDVLGIISRFMEPGQVLYDPYACTATTLIAGQILGMQWIGAEIDPKAHAIGVRELQQRPMDLFAFGGEMPEPVVRETIEAPKDTSRQGVFESDENSSKKRSRIEKPPSDIKNDGDSRENEPADPATEARPVELHAACLECEAVDRCMRHDPRANCLQEFLDFEKAVEEGREEDKIPNITWCSTIRNCPSVDWEGGICTKTGNLVKDQTYCPTQHLVGKQPEKKRTAKRTDPSCVPCKVFEECKTKNKPRPGCTQDVNKPKEKKPRDCFGKDYGMLGGIARCADCSDHDDCYKAWSKKERNKPCCGTPKKSEKPDHGTGGGPQPFVQHCCGTCGHHKGRKTFHESCPRLGELLFKKGTKSAKVLMNETASTPCEHWTDVPGDLYTTVYVDGKDLSPSLGTCPDKCPYKVKEKSSCGFTDQQFLRMESCPTGALQSSPEGQKRQLENMARALARLSAHLPSEDQCQCFPCPDGVIHCGIGDKNCPFSKNPFEGLALCPMQNPRRVRQILRERPLKFVNIKEQPAEKPNCGGKRPAISRCPDSCPDRSCEKEGGYPQGRCKQTGQKLREMQTCPNDPPKKSASKKSKKESETA